MSLRIQMAAVALIGASALATTAWGQAAPEDSKVETFATLPSAEGTENICQQADGSLYVTIINQAQLLKIAPDGTVSEFAKAPNMMHFLGAGCGDGQIATIAYGKTFRKPNPSGQGNILDFSDTDTHVLMYDLSGKQTADIAVPGAGLNGLDYAGGGIYFSTDSSGGRIYRIDAASKTADVWFNDDKFGPVAGGPLPIGVNGARAVAGYVYFSSFAGNAGIYKVKIGDDGKPQGDAVAVEEGVRADDFDVAPDGSVYFPSGTSLYKVAAGSTEATKFADPIQGGPSAWVSPDGKFVYWPTRGGTANQRICRIAL